MEPTDDTSPDGPRIDRRAYLAALSATAATGLAGCGSDGGGDGGGGTGDGNQNLGERVPAITLISMAGVPGGNNLEQTTKYVADLLTNELGVEASVTVKEFLTFFADLAQGKRTQNMHINVTPPYLRYLDPYPLFDEHSILSAGAAPPLSNTQYANCEFTTTVEDSVATGDQAERRQLTNEAHGIASEDVLLINLYSSNTFDAWRTDMVDPHVEPGNVGINDRNIPFMMNVEAIEGDDVVIGTTSTGGIDQVEWWSTVYSIGWTQTLFCGLTYFDQHQEIQPHLATDWEIGSNARTFRFDLREDATFHDGEPITSEDVKWTYEWLQTNNGTIPDVSSWPYDSIETPDDHTVVVNLSEPNAAWFNSHVPLWGIFPKHQMVPAGAEENPTDVDIGNNEIIGSGPYQLREFRPKEILDLEPYEDHWVTPPSNMVLTSYQDPNSARRAFEEGSLKVFFSMSAEYYQRVEEEMSDVAATSVTPSITDWHIAPQHDFGPSKFRAFRLAVSQALDRQFINQTSTRGTGNISTRSSVLGESHPFYPENPDEVLTTIAPSETGDVEAAKQTLRDAGWGWDDQGRLHYPPDADTEPRWPSDQSPANLPDEFPCVSELTSG